MSGTEVQPLHRLHRDRVLPARYRGGVRRCTLQVTVSLPRPLRVFRAISDARLCIECIARKTRLRPEVVRGHVLEIEKLMAVTIRADRCADCGNVRTVHRVA